MQNGFIPSTGGNYGAGVYFSDKKQTALSYANDRSAQRKSNPVILKCRISKNEYHADDIYVVKDKNKIKIVKV